MFDPKGNMKPDTWIGFLKMDSSPRVMAGYGRDEDGTEFSEGVHESYSAGSRLSWGSVGRMGRERQAIGSSEGT